MHTLAADTAFMIAPPADQVGRTMTTLKGKTVTTSLSDRDALALIASNPSKFARDLSRKAQSAIGLSHDQIVWLHVLAQEAQEAQANAQPSPAAPGAPKPQRKAGVALGDMARIVALFAAAQQHLQYPKINLATPMTSEGNFEVCLSVAGQRSKYPGTINVASSRHYGSSQFYGRIDTAGNFQIQNDCPPAVVELLRCFAADPEGVARSFGKLTGDCCFCSRALTDERSTSKGYGPTCAKNFGLSW